MHHSKHERKGSLRQILVIVVNVNGQGERVSKACANIPRRFRTLAECRMYDGKCLTYDTTSEFSMKSEDLVCFISVRRAQHTRYPQKSQNSAVKTEIVVALSN